MGVTAPAGQIILRWDTASNCAPLLEVGGVDTVWLRTADDAVAAACRAAGATVLPANGIRLVDLAEMGRARPGEAIALKDGIWPGAQSGARGEDGGWVAGATHRPWVEANGYLPGYVHALYPDRAVVLGYLPDQNAGVDAKRVLPFDALELALIDAWAGGGNYILAPDAAYREALLAGKQPALEAWKRMGQTARWLKEQRALFRQSFASTITVLVEPGDATAEIAKLMYRQSASPDLVSAQRVPPPDPKQRRVIVAAGIRPPEPQICRLLLGHARAGATLVTDEYGAEGWWRTPDMKVTRRFEDRDFYSFGSGRIVAYKEAIVDPGEFALDAIDLAGDERPVRVWECPAAIATVAQAGPGAKPTLRLINYGSPRRGEILARVCGVFESATLLRPESAPVALHTFRRGKGTEVMVPGLNRLAVVAFG